MRKVYDHENGKDAQLEPYQEQALYTLMEQPRYVLNWEMSLGKTLTILTHINDVYYEAVLIIAPNSVALKTWPDEIKKWWPNLSYSIITGDETQRLSALNAQADIYLVGSHNIQWLCGQYIKKNKRKKWEGALPYDLIILDELTEFKSWKSARWKTLDRALNDMKPRPPFRIGLTGTLIPNGEIDLYAQLKLIDGGKRLGKTITGYVGEYFNEIRKKNITLGYELLPGKKKKIHALISDIVESRNTADHRELPNLHIHDEVLVFNEFEREQYEYLEREYVIEVAGLAKSVKTASDLSNKLLQLTSGAVYLDKDRKHFEEVNTLKLDILEELYEEHSADNFLVIYRYQHERDRMLARFPDAEAFRIDKIDAWNRGEIPMLLGHPGNMSHGLNMQFGGNRMVMPSPPWSEERYKQVIARIHRFGLEKDMHLHRFFIKGTRDLRIKQRLARRMSDEQYLMDEMKRLTAKYEKEIQQANRVRSRNRGK